IKFGDAVLILDRRFFGFTEDRGGPLCAVLIGLRGSAESKQKNKNEACQFHRSRHAGSRHMRAQQRGGAVDQRCGAVAVETHDVISFLINSVNSGGVWPPLIFRSISAISPYV